jgi:hypothetical protein
MALGNYRQIATHSTLYEDKPNFFIHVALELLLELFSGSDPMIGAFNGRSNTLAAQFLLNRLPSSLPAREDRV